LPGKIGLKADFARVKELYIFKIERLEGLHACKLV